MMQANPTTKNPPLASVNRIGHQFGKHVVLKDIELQIQAGEVVAVLGPNGAGKTTLINLMLGVYQPTHGSIELFGDRPGALSARQRIGVMLQQAELAETLKVHELLRQFASYYPQSLPVPQLLAMAGLQKQADQAYGKLSGGQKRRVQFAVALAGEPDLLFLDEPTTGLDVKARRVLWGSISDYVKRGAGVVLTTHYLEEADALADRIIVINHGNIVASGTPREIKQRVSLKQIICRTQLSAERLKAHTLIENVTLVAESKDELTEYQLLTHNAEQVLRDLLADDNKLSDLQVTGAGLEEAFLALTEDETDASTGESS